MADSEVTFKTMMCRRPNSGNNCFFDVLTGKPAKFIHQTDAPLGRNVGQVEGLTSNEEREPAFAQLQSIVTVWPRVTARRSMMR